MFVKENRDRKKIIIKRTGRSYPYNFSFLSLVLSKAKQICIKKRKQKKEK